jgi:hypothetical protein
VIARSAIVALAVAGSAIALSAASPQQPRPTANAATDDMVAVGVACGDGTFVPLAERANGRWRPLIEPDDRVDFFFGVLTPRALRLPRQGWTLHPGRAGISRPLVLRSPRSREADVSDCFFVQPFDSDAPRLPRRPLLSGAQLLPQLGNLGSLGPARFEPGEDVTGQPDESSRRVAARIVRNVHAVERRVLRDYQGESPVERFAGRSEVRSVVRVMTMTRHHAGGGEWYFFQARKQYGEWYVFEGKRMYKDWARLLVHGWVRSSSDGLSVHRLTGGFDDDDGKSSSVYRMTGVLVLGERTVWIAEGSGHEWQWYEVFELGPGDVAPLSVLKITVHGA